MSNKGAEAGAQKLQKQSFPFTLPLAGDENRHMESLLLFTSRDNPSLSSVKK